MKKQIVIQFLSHFRDFSFDLYLVGIMGLEGFAIINDSFVNIVEIDGIR